MEDKRKAKTVKYTVVESDDVVAALFLRTGMPIMAHVVINPDWRVFNALIGCEIASMADTKVPGLHLWIDDVGAVSGEKRINSMASVIAGQPIWGDALLIGLNDIGETRSVTEEEAFSAVEIIANAIDRRLNEDR
jgi:hypothetical protein